MGPLHQATCLLVAGSLVQGLAAGQLYQTNFSTAAGWTLGSGAGCNSDPSYRWAADATPSSHFAGAFRSAPASLNFNNGVQAGPSFGGVACGTATSPHIDLFFAPDSSFVEFWFSYEFNQASGCDLDPVRLQVSNNGFSTLLLDECLPTPGQVSMDWHRLRYDLQRSWGLVQFRFTFSGGIGVGFNSPSGPFIDDFAVDSDCVFPNIFCLSDPNIDFPSGARFGLIGTPSVSANNFRLYSQGTTRNSFAVAFYGSGQASVASGAGTLCVGGSLYRLGVAPTGPNGTPSWLVDLTVPPDPGGQITSGSTWHFQSWFRDGPGTWNFSDGMTVEFCD